VANALQQKKMVEFADPKSVLNRYPPNMLLQRAHRFVAGSEAYCEVIMIFVRNSVFCLFQLLSVSLHFAFSDIKYSVYIACLHLQLLHPYVYVLKISIFICLLFLYHRRMKGHRQAMTLWH
jgi:hypothetical protein